MFCARCGQQIPDASELCPLCGREAVLHVPAPAPSDSPAAPLANPRLRPVGGVAFGGGPSGVRGWLLFFCIAITLLSPLVVFFQSAALVRRLGLQGGAGALLDVARALFGMVTGIFLWMARPVAMMLLRIYFAMVGVTIFLAVLFIVEAGLRHVQPLKLVEAATPVAQLVGYSLIWIAYFLKSVRVRNTYGRNL